MSIFSRLSDYFHYLRDSVKSSKISAQIDQFSLSDDRHKILVSYRVGRHRIARKKFIGDFTGEFFSSLSNYDQHRLVKFSTLQSILDGLFSSRHCAKEQLVDFIHHEASCEQLF